MRTDVAGLGVSLGLALALAPHGRALALELAGGEFQVNTYTSCNQLNPAVAPQADGGFVVVWASGSSVYEQDGSISGVFGQRYAAEGVAVGGEFQINQFTQDEQARPDVAERSNGGFVVVWQSWQQDDSGYAVIARRYRANGNPHGGEFQVNTFTPSWQEGPAVAATPDGFVVAWVSYEQDGDVEGVFAQRFDDEGTRLGTEFRVNTYTRGPQESVDIAASPDGRFVIVWGSGFDDPAEQDGSGSGIYGQRYAANGSPAGGEFRVNQITLDDQVRPVVAMADDASFLVAWESKNVEGNPLTASDGVAARRFAADGSPLGDQFLVNTYTTAAQEQVAITRAPNGQFLVGWAGYGVTTGADASSRGVYVRPLAADGSPAGDVIHVNTFVVGEQEDIAVAGLSDDGFVAVWESGNQDGDQEGVFGQRFSSPLCGDGNGDGSVTATDSLFILSTSVGAAECALCTCDANGSGGVTATDALLVLQAAVGQPVSLTCPSC